MFMVAYPLPPNTLVDSPVGYDFFNADSASDALQYVISHPEKYYLKGAVSSTARLYDHHGMTCICEYNFNTKAAKWRTAFAPAQGRGYT